VELETTLEKTRFAVEQKPDELNASDYAVLLTCLGNAFAVHSLLGGPQMQLDSQGQGISNCPWACNC